MEISDGHHFVPDYSSSVLFYTIKYTYTTLSNEASIISIPILSKKLEPIIYKYEIDPIFDFGWVLIRNYTIKKINCGGLAFIVLRRLSSIFFIKIKNHAAHILI